MARGVALCGVGVAVLAAALGIAGGCDSGGAEGGGSDVATLKAKVGKLSDENMDLKRQVFEANHKVAIEQDAASTLRSDLKKLQKEHADLQRDYEELAANSRTAGGGDEAHAKAPAATSAVAPAASPRKDGGEPESPQEGTPRVRELAAKQADLEKRVTEIRAKIVAGQAKISSLARATVDQKVDVPPGGKVENGQVYRRHKILQYPHYVFVPIGPAVIPGDFRTAHDRTSAINAARAELAPLHVELRSLTEDLEKVKAELAELRKAQPDAAPDAEK